VTSVAQLSYEEAQEIIDNQLDETKFIKDKDLTLDEMSNMKEKLILLKGIAKNRRKVRSGCDLFDKE
jgi:exoribonuclease R